MSYSRFCTLKILPILVVKMNNKIFISHSSKDIELVNKFIDLILILGLGISREEIFCTSIQGTHIKSGADFKDTIKQELFNSKAVIQIITKNYKSSEICLNEMGAAWATSETVIPLVAAPFNYDLGFIHATSQQLKLNSKEDLIKFFDDYKHELFSINISISNYNAKVEEFIQFTNSYFNRQEIKTETVFFYDEQVKIRGVLREGIFSHPPFEENTPVEQLSFHRYYFLDLKQPVDILSNKIMIEEGDFNLSRVNVNKIHIVPDETFDMVNLLKSLKDNEVIVEGRCWGGFSAWHQTEVMMLYSDIKAFN